MMPNDSTGHDDIKLNRFTLSFIGESKELENSFLDSYFNNSIKHLRIAIFLAFFLYAIFGIVDREIATGKLHYIIRYAIVCPGLICLYLFSLTSYFKKYMQIAVSMFIILAGFGIVLMHATGPPNDTTLRNCMGIMLVLIFGYSFARCRFMWATFAGFTVSISYLFVELFIVDFHRPSFINNIFHLVSTKACSGNLDT